MSRYRCTFCGTIIEPRQEFDYCGPDDDTCDHCHERDCSVCHSENFTEYYACPMCGGTSGSLGNFDPCPFCKNLKYGMGPCHWCLDDLEFAEIVKKMYPYHNNAITTDKRSSWITKRRESHANR